MRRDLGHSTLSVRYISRECMLTYLTVHICRHCANPLMPVTNGITAESLERRDGRGSQHQE